MSSLLIINSSCERNLLEEEQYFNLIYLKSESNNIYPYTHSMNDSISTGYVLVGSGGSMPLTQDIVVTLEIDTSILNRYNFRNFGPNVEKYVKLVDPQYMVIPSTRIILEKGDAAGLKACPIEIDANMLSPDSTYMIPLKIVKTAEYQVNTEKEFVLYKPELRNQYVSPKSRSYRMKGTREVSGGLPTAMTMNKNLVPISYNKVRLFPDNISSSTSLVDIQNKAIVLVIESDNTVKVKPYKNIEVEDLGTSVYHTEEKVFTLSYRYRLTPQSNWIKVNEALTRVE